MNCKPPFLPIFFLSALFFALMFLSCSDPQRDNPNDPGGINYQGSRSSSSSGGSIYCGGELYDPETHFCYNSIKVGQKCGARTEIFDPDLYKCVDNGKIYLKTPVSYGGKNYEAVLIGTQTWMAENLNYNASGSVCYGNNSTNCSIYGRLYNWAMTMDIDTSFNSTLWGGSDVKHKGICPDGWHLPSLNELNMLTAAVGGNTDGRKLKATSGWNSNGNGTDEYGFSALPGGYGFSVGSFNNVGNNGGWWRATEYSSIYAYYWDMHYNRSDVGRDGIYKSLLFSVRCVQD